MANTIKIKQSSTASNVPATGELTTGELAINVTDRKLYSKDATTVFEIAPEYSHPTHPGDDFSVDTGPLTGATVVSDIDINVTTDTLGHVTDANGVVSTRALTLDDIDTNSVKKNATETITGTWTLDGVVTTSDYGTGGRVKDGTDVSRPIGFNVMPVYEIDANDTFDLAHNGMIWHKDAGVAVTFTFSSDTTIPQGATWVVHNDDTEDLTIAQNSTTIYWLEAGAAPTAGNVTVEQGGIVTVYKYSDTEAWVWGSKEAGAGAASTLGGLSDVTITAAATGDILRYNGTAWVDYPDSNYASSSHTHTVSSLTDTTISGLADDNILIYDTGTARWRNYSMSGDLDLNDVGVTTLQASAITGKTALGSGLLSTDELLVSDGGILKKMDISVIEAYMQANLTGFGTVNGTGIDNYIAVWNGTGDIDAVGSFNIANAVDKTGTETITGAWEWQDNASIRFGTDNDARMYFDAVDDLRIDLNDTMNFRVRGGTSGTEAMFHALANGEFGAYYNGSLKLTTNNTGINVTGTVTADGVDLDDNHHLYLGTGDDADIYFNATDLYIDLNAAVDFRLRGGAATTDPMITCIADSGVYLYYNAREALRTQAYNGSSITSSVKIEDHAGTDRDAGFNHVKEISMTTASIELSNLHAGNIIKRTGASTVDVDMAALTTEFPVGSMCTVINHGTGGTLTIDNDLETMYVLDGSGTVSANTGFALAIGGVVTIWRQASSVYYVWGAGIP